MNAESEVIGNDREIEVAAGPSQEMALISAVAKAELDQQITTARAFPRSLKKFVDECRDMACLNEKVAAECFYAIPRDGKMIEGPSVRLGEIVQSAWGNCQSGARIVDEGEDFITAQGVFFDLERNVRVTMEVRRRISSTKNGHKRRYSQDMIGVTGSAACSIALRNAIFRGIPKAFWNDIYLEARKVAAGDAKSLVANRAEALRWLHGKHSVTEKMVLDALGLKGIEDIGLEELATLRGMITAVKDGEVTIAAIFAPKEIVPPQAKPKTEEPKKRGRPAKPAGTAPSADKAQDKSGPAISLDQATMIYDKLEAEGIGRTLLCAHFEIGEVTQLPAAKYQAAIAWIDEQSDNG
jgi:hypothetical protein